MSTRASIAISILFLAPLASSAADCTSLEAQLTRTLKSGSRGNDVRTLQMFLNATPETRVASKGPGSPGREGVFYGKATAAAVMRFQVANQIDNTGVFGPITRAAFIANLCGVTKPAQKPLPPPTVSNEAKPTPSLPTPPPASLVPQTPAAPATEAARAPYKIPSFSFDSLSAEMRELFEKSKDIMSQMGTPFSNPNATSRMLIIGDPSPSGSPPGTVVAIRGNGFEAPATIQIGNTTLPLQVIDFSSATFNLPATSTPGLYDISVNVNGKTSNVERFAITKQGVTIPNISKISPTSGNVGSQITLTGTGFLDVNDIEAGSSNITNISSDGTSIRFTLTANPMFLSNGKLLPTYPLFIRVRNINGTSNTIRLTID